MFKIYVRSHRKVSKEDHTVLIQDIFILKCLQSVFWVTKYIVSGNCRGETKFPRRKFNPKTSAYSKNVFQIPVFGHKDSFKLLSYFLPLFANFISTFTLLNCHLYQKRHVAKQKHWVGVDGGCRDDTGR